MAERLTDRMSGWVNEWEESLKRTGLSMVVLVQTLSSLGPREQFWGRQVTGRGGKADGRQGLSLRTREGK